MFNLSITHSTALVVICSGDSEPEDFFGLIAMLRELLARRPGQQLLVDLISMQPLPDEKRQALFRHASEQLPGARIAVVQRDPIDLRLWLDPRDSERIATFADHPSAMEWLGRA